MGGGAQGIRDMGPEIPQRRYRKSSHGEHNSTLYLHISYPPYLQEDLLEFLIPIGLVKIGLVSMRN